MTKAIWIITCQCHLDHIDKLYEWLGLTINVNKHILVPVHV